MMRIINTEFREMENQRYINNENRKLLVKLIEINNGKNLGSDIGMSKSPSEMALKKESSLKRLRNNSSKMSLGTISVKPKKFD